MVSWNLSFQCCFSLQQRSRFPPRSRFLILALCEWFLILRMKQSVYSFRFPATLFLEDYINKALAIDSNQKTLQSFSHFPYKLTALRAQMEAAGTQNHQPPVLSPGLPALPKSFDRIPLPIPLKEIVFTT